MEESLEGAERGKNFRGREKGLVHSLNFGKARGFRGCRHS